MSLIDKLNSVPMPPLGDARKRYKVELTEPEINALFSAIEFVRSNCAAVASMAKAPMKYWEHYGQTLLEIDQRLQQFDDDNAPYEAANEQPKAQRSTPEAT